MAKKKNLTSEDQKLWDAYKQTVKPLDKNVDSSLPCDLIPATSKHQPVKSSSFKDFLFSSQKRSISEAKLPSLEALPQSRRKRKVKIEAELDLHGMTQAQAYQNLINFITHCYAKGKQTTLIITGKGRPVSKTEPFLEEERGILRRSISEWLSNAELRPYIIEYAQASFKDGGSGAFYVYLRRNKYLSRKK